MDNDLKVYMEGSKAARDVDDTESVYGEGIPTDAEYAHTASTPEAPFAELTPLHGGSVESLTGSELPFSSRASPSAQRWRRAGIGGGSAPVARPIQLDYNSDDGRIIDLKRQGHSDDYVSKVLREEGRIRYLPKSVSSRWLRLRKMLENAENERLDDELTDWHDGDDDLLMQCYALADEKHQLELERLEQIKWKDVANHFAHQRQVKKYTATACRERFQSLFDGSASVPFEQDPDPVGRRARTEARIAEAKRRRAEEADRKKRIEDEQQQEKADKKNIKDEKVQKREEEKNRRDTAKAEEQRARNNQKAEKSRMRSAREAHLAAERQKVASKRRERDAVQELYYHITGRRLTRFRRTAAPVRRNESFVRRGNEETDYISSGRSPDGPDTDADADAASILGEYDDEDVERSPSFHLRHTDDRSTDKDSENEQPECDGKYKLTTKEDSLFDPRSVLTRAELELLLFQRKLPRSTRRESHANIVARLAMADSKLSDKNLNMLLGAGTSGQGISRLDMMDRKKKIRILQKKDAQKSAAGSKGYTPFDPALETSYDRLEGYSFVSNVRGKGHPQ